MNVAFFQCTGKCGKEDQQFCGEIRESGIQRKGSLRMRMDLGSREGDGKRGGHGGKFFSKVPEKR